MRHEMVNRLISSMNFHQSAFVVEGGINVKLQSTKSIFFFIQQALVKHGNEVEKMISTPMPLMMV